MQYEPIIFLQVIMENPSAGDPAWVWVSGILAAANIAQYSAAAWRTRQDLKRLAERDRLDERRQRAIEELLEERGDLIARLKALEGRNDGRTA